MENPFLMNAVKRLKEWPLSFNLNQAAQLLDGDYDRARVYLKRWVKQDLIKSAGLKTGWYYNTTAHPEAERKQFLLVLQSVYAGAVVMGHSVLHRSGWTTQLPNQLHVAVPRRCQLEMSGVIVHSRSIAWYQSLKNEIVPTSMSEFGLPCLTPAASLADLIKESKGELNIDEYDIPENQYHQIFEILKSFKVSQYQLTPPSENDWEIL